MLRRLNDERVFTGSQDVVYSAASASIAQRNGHHRGHAPLVDGARNRMLQQENGAQYGDEDSDGGSADDEEEDDDEDEGDDEEGMFRDSRHPPSERYHPQHPYNAQLNVLAKTAKSPRDRDVKIVRSHRGGKHASVGVYDTATQPMEFVFLPNGEIRPRDECPPGLALPPPATAPIASETHRHLLAGHAAEQELHQRAYLQEQKQQPADTTLHNGDTSRRQHRKTAEDTKAATRQSERSRPRQPARVRSLPESSNDASSSSSDSSSSSRTPVPAVQATQRRRVESTSNATHREERSVFDSPEPSASSSSSEYEKDEEKENVRRQDYCGPPAAASKEKKKEVIIAGTRRSSSRHESEPVLTRPQDQSHHQSHRQPQRESNEEQHSEQRKMKAKSTRQPPDMMMQRRQEKEKGRRSPSSSASDDNSQASWSYRPKVVKYDSVHVHHSRSAAKMDVRDLLNDNANVPKLTSRSKKASVNDDQREKIAYLEQELQREKKRVLEKMSQLLEEQGKNQQLQRQLDVTQSQLASKEREVELKVKEAVHEKDESFGKAEAQWKASVQSLEDQVHVKDATVLRLETEKEQLKQSLTKLKDKKQQQESSSAQVADRESASTKRQIEKIISKLKKFHTQVENWKANSKEAMVSCEYRKSEMQSLVESLWLDFPAFPFLDNAAKTGDNDANEPTNMILFLKKRLRLREDELRETHVKYVELKELCARQCVREADLQNFINEHRLRGNLVIRKDDAATTREHAAVEDDATKRNVRFHAPQQQQRSDVKTKMIVNRATNTSPTYHENGNNSEYDEDEENDDAYDGVADADAAEEDDYEDDNQHEYYLQEPKVFVQVSRDGVYEHTPRRSASSSAVLKKLEEEQRGRKKKEFRDVERIRLVPSPTLARRYERVPEEPLRTAASRRKAPASNNSHAIISSRTASRLHRPTAATATASTLNGARSNSGAVRRKPNVQPPPAIIRTTRSRSAARTAGANTAPWM
uniref:Uncharacterized protein n=1 Tax=Globisporangium ultimum (strain ATCC 200006 / CBS 805.95 / DAOM BR144) TaxID=431595 RepID=K3X3T8_GLOUD